MSSIRFGIGPGGARLWQRGMLKCVARAHGMRGLESTWGPKPMFAAFSSGTDLGSIKELRQMTGSPMMECKKALQECSGDVDGAVDWLRKRGVMAATKKSSRNASEGVIAIHKKANAAVMVEINSETDFAARNDAFRALAENVTEHAFRALETSGGNVDEVRSIPSQEEGAARDMVIAAVAKIRENIVLRRADALTLDGEGVIVSYTHNALGGGQPSSTSVGGIGALVALKGGNGTDVHRAEMEALAMQIAMHVAAANPRYLNVSQVPADAIEKERKILAEQAKREMEKSRANSKKKKKNPNADAVVGRIVEGRLAKFYGDAVLEEQVAMLGSDGKDTVGDLVRSAADKLGTDIALSGFLRFQVGENIQRG